MEMDNEAQNDGGTRIHSHNALNKNGRRANPGKKRSMIEEEGVERMPMKKGRQEEGEGSTLVGANR